MVLFVLFFFADFLRFAQERWARFSFARRSPRHHANERLVRSSFHAWRSLYLFRFAQHLRPHRHVLLLHGGRHGSTISKIHLVEKIPHRFPDGTFFSPPPLIIGKKKLHRSKPHPCCCSLAGCKLMVYRGNRCGLLARLFDRHRLS